MGQLRVNGINYSGPSTLPATSIAYDNASSNLAAGNVQAAIDKIDSRIDNMDNRIGVLNFTYPNAGEDASIPFPYGFTRENCCILAHEFYKYDRWYTVTDTYNKCHLWEAVCFSVHPDDTTLPGCPGRVVLLKIL